MAQTLRLENRCRPGIRWRRLFLRARKQHEECLWTAGRTSLPLIERQLTARGRYTEFSESLNATPLLTRRAHASGRMGTSLTFIGCWQEGFKTGPGAVTWPGRGHLWLFLVDRPVCPFRVQNTLVSFGAKSLTILLLRSGQSSCLFSFFSAEFRELFVPPLRLLSYTPCVHPTAM